jgi:CubicO group peptidase (beta-lactamase class C family)
MLNETRLSRRIREALRNQRIPGLAIGVVGSNTSVFARGFGHTTAERDGLPVSEKTLFRIGSTTKPLTATVVLQLAEEGLLPLDEPLAEAAPEVRLSEPGAAERITPRLLLCAIVQVCPQGVRNSDTSDRRR